jgi:2-amino-4-hydroxy-6-hydroxymethyldihydropteridine diphosphokinase
VTRAYLALGSNLGDRLGHLQSAVDGLAAHAPEVRVVGVSSVYETAPVGGPAQDDYLNAVVAIETDLGPHALLDLAHRCEDEAGRVRTTRWGPRTLDVDVLLYGDTEVDDDVLTVPHPRMWERDFVLVPLRDVAPELVRALAGDGRGVRTTEVALEVPGH